MKILIGQPKREKNLEQLIDELHNNVDVDVVLFPESYFTHVQLEKVCELAKDTTTTIVTGYKDTSDLDRACIINHLGELLLDRGKTLVGENLKTLSRAENKGLGMGYLLCMEVFYGLEGLNDEGSYDIIFNPIGVGMYSEKQFEEWTSEARKIAVSRNSLVIGSSHADGSYQNCGFSIPIAYCFDEKGNDVFVSHNDTRSRIVDTESREVEVLEFTGN